MLTELKLSDFKSFGPESKPIPLSPVTILIGANGSGKSNILDAIRFFQGVGKGLPFSQILQGVKVGDAEVFRGVRGASQEVARLGCQKFTVSLASDFSPSDFEERESGISNESDLFDCRIKHRIEHRIAVSLAPKVELDNELLRVDDIEAMSANPERLVYATKSGEMGSVNLVRVPNASTLVWLIAARALPAGFLDTNLDRVAKCWRSYLSQFQFLDLSPRLMREYSSDQAEDLGEQGENLSQILASICQNSEIKSQILEWISELIVPKVDAIEFYRTKLGEVMLKLREANDVDRWFFARSLSDGTLRFLGLLAALYSAVPGQLFLLEEIETGLHPTRVQLVVELLERFAASKNIQIIATTHSPQVLLSLSQDALRNVIHCARDEEKHATVTHRLGDLPHFEEVTQKTQIDRLFSTGWMEHVV